MRLVLPAACVLLLLPSSTRAAMLALDSATYSATAVRCSVLAGDRRLGDKGRVQEHVAVVVGRRSRV